MSRDRLSLAFARLIASIGFSALTIELVKSLRHSFALHLNLAEALYLHFRYFTILTNWGIVLLLVATLLNARRGRPAPHPSLFGAALIYILVVCITYEALLRRSAAPQGLFFVTDLAMHDIVPVFYLIFWLSFAPKHGLGWRDAFTWLAVPAAYLTMILAAGAHGQGYPYDFLDVAKIGDRGVLTNALLFLLAFLLLGLGTVWRSRVLTPDGGRVDGAAKSGALSDRKTAW